MAFCFCLKRLQPPNEALRILVERLCAKRGASRRILVAAVRQHLQKRLSFLHTLKNEPILDVFVLYLWVLNHVRDNEQEAFPDRLLFAHRVDGGIKSTRLYIVLIGSGMIPAIKLQDTDKRAIRGRSWNILLLFPSSLLSPLSLALTTLTKAMIDKAVVMLKVYLELICIGAWTESS